MPDGSEAFCAADALIEIGARETWRRVVPALLAAAVILAITVIVALIVAA